MNIGPPSQLPILPDLTMANPQEFSFSRTHLWPIVLQLSQTSTDSSAKMPSFHKCDCSLEDFSYPAFLNKRFTLTSSPFSKILVPQFQSELGLCCSAPSHIKHRTFPRPFDASPQVAETVWLKKPCSWSAALPVKTPPKTLSFSLVHSIGLLIWFVFTTQVSHWGAGLIVPRCFPGLLISCLFLSFEYGFNIVGTNSTKHWELWQGVTNDTLKLLWLVWGIWNMNKIVSVLGTLSLSGWKFPNI